MMISRVVGTKAALACGHSAAWPEAFLTSDSVTRHCTCRSYARGWSAKFSKCFGAKPLTCTSPSWGGCWAAASLPWWLPMSTGLLPRPVPKPKARLRLRRTTKPSKNMSTAKGRARKKGLGQKTRIPKMRVTRIQPELVGKQMWTACRCKQISCPTDLPAQYL